MLALLLLMAFFANAQSLKDALFSGKLKNTSGTTIRKGDDLTTKMDTASKPAIADTLKATALATDTSAKTPLTQSDSNTISTASGEPDSATSANTTEPATAATPIETPTAPKTNNTIWKAYADSVAGALKAEALSSKKVKRGSYFVTVSYAIETDGLTSVGDVFVSPENDYLQQQIKDRMTIDSPRLSPVLNSAGAPRKVTRKYNFTVVKE